MEKNINVIIDLDGSKVVLINDVRFKSRRTLDWNDVEVVLKEYVGTYFEINETAEKIYIGTDFPDEFCYSKDTLNTKGANEKAKANMVSAIGKLIQIATNKATYPDINSKHGSKAKYGWYRYNLRFGLPVYEEEGNLVRYNTFSTRMLVRCDEDGKLYLYDMIRIKKETCNPLGQ